MLKNKNDSLKPKPIERKKGNFKKDFLFSHSMGTSI